MAGTISRADEAKIDASVGTPARVELPRDASKQSTRPTDLHTESTRSADEGAIE